MAVRDPLKTTDVRERRYSFRDEWQSLQDYDRARLISLMIWLGAALATFAFLMYMIVTPW